MKVHLPPAHRADYQMKGYADAKAKLEKVIRYLESLNPSAARSLEEGLEEALTLHAWAFRISFAPS